MGQVTDSTEARGASAPDLLIKDTEPSLQVVTVELSKLVPYARNPRKNDQAVSRMVSSIKEFGFKVPVLAKSDGAVIDGHLRLKAAHELKLTSVPVILCDDWTEAQVKAFRLLVNRSVGWAEWDTDLLKLELADLKMADFDLLMTGFDSAEIDSFFKDVSADEAADAPAPEPPKDPVTRPGDVWILGKHRLMCGDSTVATDVAKLLSDGSPNLMVTDPPYGVEHDPHWREVAGVSGMGPQAPGLVHNDDRIDWRESYALFTGAVAYIWHAGRHASSVQKSIEEAGFVVRSQIIWFKPRFVFGRGDYHWQHEPCWYAVREGANSNWSADRKQTTVWQIESLHIMSGARKTREDRATGHSTQKPIECMRRPIQNHTERGDSVYEPFSGSGTTIVAAESIGRICYAMEISPAYVDVAVKRWQEFTGQAAILEGDGRKFDEIGQR